MNKPVLNKRYKNLLKQLESKYPDKRRHTLYMLGRRYHKKTPKAVFEKYFVDIDPHVRRIAANILFRLGDRLAEIKYMTSLIDSIKNKQDEEWESCVMVYLSEIGRLRKRMMDLVCDKTVPEERRPMIASLIHTLSKPYELPLLIKQALKLDLKEDTRKQFEKVLKTITA
ncbi:MAG: hypothetical protein A2252_00095 [Elusimicrobia bacterium RIFOXYA2_FULL_39_19]|nr:MAG: hypothetical protein A2252_00095 [Elusimicrobia bacterium RIFOXYA2_FULL_39_19]